MNDENKNLMNAVMRKHLKRALESDKNADDSNAEVKQAMDIADRLNESDKIEIAKTEQAEKQALAEKQAMIGMWISIGSVVATVVVAPVISHCCNKDFGKMTMLFEKDYTFTTTPGKALSKVFNFGRKN